MRFSSLGLASLLLVGLIAVDARRPPEFGIVSRCLRPQSRACNDGADDVLGRSAASTGSKMEHGPMELMVSGSGSILLFIRPPLTLTL